MLTLPSSTTNMSAPRWPREKIVVSAGSMTSDAYARMVSIMVSVRSGKAISGRKAGKSRRAEGSVNAVAMVLLWGLPVDGLWAGRFGLSGAGSRGLGAHSGVRRVQPRLWGVIHRKE